MPKNNQKLLKHEYTHTRLPSVILTSTCHFYLQKKKTETSNWNINSRLVFSHVAPAESSSMPPPIALPSPLAWTPSCLWWPYCVPTRQRLQGPWCADLSDSWLETNHWSSGSRRRGATRASPFMRFLILVWIWPFWFILLRILDMKVIDNISSLIDYIE